MPLSPAAIGRAIELNGVDVAMNKAALTWGRRAALEPDVVAAIAERLSGQPARAEWQSLEVLVERRATFLTAYQNAAYARRYAAVVERVRDAERSAAPGRDDLAGAVARNLFKLMAAKDEYEVARLFADISFDRQLRRTFASWDRLEFHLAPPLFAKRDPETGELMKSNYGPWMRSALRLLAGFRGLRGTPFDPFRYSTDRRLDRRLLADYEATLGQIAERLNAANHDAAVALAQYPEKIRGYGHVKKASADNAAAAVTRMRATFLASPERMPDAAE
jgi:indolepyruvate ferredoxin oxidoreductase